MLKLGSLDLDDGRPRLAVPFTDRESPAQVAEAVRRGLDIAELRVDRFSSVEIEAFSGIIERFRGIPSIGTIRMAAEGGDWKGDESARLAAFRALARHVDAVDVELSAREIRAEVIAVAHEHGGLAIVSHHDFAATPGLATLHRIAEAALEAGADLVKVAVQPHGPGDVRTLARFCLERADTPLVAIGMGEQGLATRLLLPALGSRISFAALDAGSETAPGQLPLAEMRAWLDRLYPGRPGFP